MRCPLATAVTADARAPINPARAALRFVTRPLADGLTLADHLVAGAAASAAAVTALHPMDTLKTLIQAATKSPAAATTPAGAVTAAAAPANTNAVSALLSTLRGGGGVGALYRGLAPSLAGQVPAGAIKFAAYETLTQLARTLAPRAAAAPGSAAAIDYACAALAFVACSVVMVPAELLKQRLQAGVYPGFGAGLRNMARHEGIAGMYTGYRATLLRDVPYTMLEFGLYAQLKRALRFATRRERLTPAQELAMGGVAGGMTGLLTSPLDLAKTRLMTQAGAGTGAARQYAGVADVLVKVAREEGISGLFKGCSARVVWLVPFTAVYFGVHEAAKRTLRERRCSALHGTADHGGKAKGGM